MSSEPRFDMDWVEEAYVETLNGQPITGVYEMKGRCFVFTRDATFILAQRKIHWYTRLWRKFRGWLR